MLRPIVCICNDLYASSLTRLRAHAYIVRFQRPADLHLIKRLRDICERERLKADSRALTALVGIAQGDMRGCLNTLQVSTLCESLKPIDTSCKFIQSKNQDVTEDVVRAATVGMKEADTSFMTVLTDLFSPPSKKRLKELGLRDEDLARYVARLSHEVEGSGSLDKLLNGTVCTRNSVAPDELLEQVASSIMRS